MRPEGILDGSIPYHTIQLTAPINSQRESAQGESAQGGSETCSLCNEPDPLFEPNGANLELVLLSSSWTEPDRTGLMGSVQSDLKVSQVAVQSDLKSSSCSPVRLEIFKLMGL